MHEADSVARAIGNMPYPVIFRDADHNLIGANQIAARHFNLGNGTLKCYQAVHGLRQAPEVCYCGNGDVRVISVYEPSLGQAFQMIQLPSFENGRLIGHVGVFRPIETPLFVRGHVGLDGGPVVIDYETGSAQLSSLQLESLTAKEKEVLKWIMRGKPTSAIGIEMGISANTVNFHMKNIFGKLGAENRTHATALVFKKLLERNNNVVQEIHHRVKNNFAVLRSLVNLRRETGQMGDMAWLDVHINSFLSFHNMLLSLPSGTCVPVRDFFEMAIDNIAETLCIKERGVRVETEIEGVLLHMNVAIPYVQIINELMTNSVKHAFAPGLAGVIRVGFRRTFVSEEEEAFELLYDDNGCGMRQPIEESEGFGWRVVRGLMSQLGCTYDISGDRGMRYTIRSRHARCSPGLSDLAASLI